MDWRKIQEQIDMYNHLAEGPLRVWREHHADMQTAIERSRLLVNPLADTTALLKTSLADVGGTLALSREVLDKFGLHDSITEMQRVYRDQQSAITGARNTLLLGHRDFAAEIASASSYITMAHTAFSTFEMTRIGELIGAEMAHRDRVHMLTERLTLTHADLVASLSLRDGRLATVPSFVSELPAIDMFVHGGAIRTITPHDDYEEPTEERRIVSVRTEISLVTMEFLESTLEELKPAFRSQYRGAKARARERGDDWWAQWGSSMRRLFKGVFHNVAHDDVVLPWAKQNNKDLDDHGHPTRGTKIEWLCLGIQNAKYRAYVRTELTSALALIGLLDSTQHVDEFPEIEETFEWTELRAEFALRQILTIWKNRNQN
jgi:hypothetical protein